MRFRKLAVCMLIGMIAFCFTGASAYAAEGTTESQNQEEVTAAVANQETDPAKQNAAVLSAVEEGVSIDTETLAADQNEEEAVIEDAEDAESPEDTADMETAEAAENTEDIEAEDTADIEDEDTEDAEASQNTEKEDTAKTTVKKAEAKYSEADLRLLSALIFCEAQGESYNGKLAVAIVVMNRTRSRLYPDTVKGVIYQKHQFSPASSGKLKRALAEYDAGRFTSTAEKECIKAAKAALSGVTEIKVNGKAKDFSSYLYFSGTLKGYTFKLGHHKFK